jgi:hypothetical protein
MHLNFHFTPVLILWTLTMAALLVLLVVLFGRDRARRFPIFTAAMAMMAFRMVASRLLLSRLSMIASSTVFLVLADVAAILTLLIAVEIARLGFQGVNRKAWMIAPPIMVVIAGAVVALWGPWPAIQTLFSSSLVSVLRLMQLAAQKLDLLTDILTIQLGLLIALFGNRFHAGWRSHPQQLVIGLSAASFAQLAVRGIWQMIALHTTIHAQDDYLRVMGIEEKLSNANNAIFFAVLIWWIAWLWFDEPGAAVEVPVAATAAGEVAQLEAPAVTEDSAASPEASSEETR